MRLDGMESQPFIKLHSQQLNGRTFTRPAGLHARAPRRYWLSTLVLCICLVFLCVFQYLFLITWDLFPISSGTWFQPKTKPPSGWHFKSYLDAAWLIVVACLGFFTPFLELITWVPVRPLVAPQWLQRCWPRWPLRLHNRMLATSGSGYAFAAGGDVEEPAAATGSSSRPYGKASPKWWRQSIPTCVLHLSRPARAFLILWTLASIGAWMLPYSFRYLYLSNPANTNLYKQLSSTVKVGFPALLMRSLGRTAGWPCCMNMAMVMIPSDRSSSWLAAINMTFEEANLFHRLFGWAAMFWTFLHAIFQHVPFMLAGKAAWINEMWIPRYYSSKFDYFIANVAWVLFAVVLVTSLGYFRKRFYNLFRISHLLIWPMFALVVMHKYYIYFWLSYGIMLYAADLAQRWVFNACKQTGVLTIADEGVTRLTLPITSRHMRAGPHWAAKALYVHLGRVSAWESHPYTIASMDGNVATIYIGAVGDWSTRVHDLAKAAGPKGLEVTVGVEGPYGADLDSELADQDAVLMLAGGLGITPVGALVDRLLDQRPVAPSGRPLSVHVLWVVRKATVATMLPVGLMQHIRATDAFSMHVHVTTKADDGTEGHPLLTKSPELEGGVDVVLPPSSPFSAFLRRFICKALIVWTATLGITLGYILACQMVYVGSAYLSTPSAYATAVEGAYQASTLDSYYRNTTGLAAGMPLPAGAAEEIAHMAWPTEQPKFSAWSSSATHQVILGCVNLCVECSPRSWPPSKFPYGMAPLVCCGAKIPLAVTFVHVLFPFVFAVTLAMLVAYACKRALECRWPLFSGSAPAGLVAPLRSDCESVSLLGADGQAATAMNDSDVGHAADGVGCSGDSRLLCIREDDLAQEEASLKLPTSTASSRQLGAAEWRQGRPSFPEELSAVCAAVAAAGGSRVAVYCCGPVPMRNSVRAAVYRSADLAGCTVRLREFHLRD